MFNAFYGNGETILVFRSLSKIPEKRWELKMKIVRRLP